MRSFLDPVLEPGRGGDGVADATTRPAVCDVGEARPVDRVELDGGLRAGRDHRDGIAGSRSGPAEEGRRGGATIPRRADQRRPPGCAAEQLLTTVPVRSVLSALCRVVGPAPGQRARSPAANVPVERKGSTMRTLADACAATTGQGGRGGDAGRGGVSPTRRVA
jgi:hypothetical protein